MKVKFLIAALFFSLVAAAQPSNYIKFNTRGRWIAGMFDSTLHVPRFNGSPSLRTGGSSMDGAIAIDTTNGIFYFYQGGSWKRANLDTSAYAVTSVYRKTASDSVFYVKGGVHTFAFKDSTGVGIPTLQQVFSAEGNEAIITSSVDISPSTTGISFLMGNNGVWHDIIMQSSSQFNLSSNAVSLSAGNNNLLSIGADSIKIGAYLGRLVIDTLNYTLSTTGKKILIRDTATGLVQNIDPSLLGASSYTFTNGLTDSSGTVKLGGDLVNSTSINGKGSYSVTLDSLTGFTVKSPGLTKILTTSTQAYIYGNSSSTYMGVGTELFLAQQKSGNSISMSSDSFVLKMGGNSQLIIRPDSLNINPPLGIAVIDTLTAASNMTNKRVMTWDTVTKRWEQIAKDSVGGSGGSTINKVGQDFLISNDSLFLKDEANIYDYGAIAGGDILIPLKAALASSKKTIIIPNANFTISDTVIVPSYKRIIGNTGANITQTTSGKGILILQQDSYVSGVEFIGTGYSAAMPSSVNGEYGVKIVGSRVEVDNCKFSLLEHGVIFGGLTVLNRCIIKDNLIYANKGGITAFQNIEYSTIINNRIYDGYIGIWLRDEANLLISNNTITYNTVGIRWDGLASNSDHDIVIGNQFNHCDTMAYVLKNNTSLDFIGNHFMVGKIVMGTTDSVRLHTFNGNGFGSTTFSIINGREINFVNNSFYNPSTWTNSVGVKKYLNVGETNDALPGASISGTDNNIVRIDGTASLQDSKVSISDNGDITAGNSGTSTPVLTVQDYGNNYALGNTQSSLLLKGRWWSGDSNPSLYSSARIDLVRNAGDGAGGSNLVFKVSGTGATGLIEAFRATSYKNFLINYGTDDGNKKFRVDHNDVALTSPQYAAYITQRSTFNTTGGNIISTGAYIGNTSSRSSGGNSLTNIGLQVDASGGQNNYGIIVSSGSVGIGTQSPTVALDVVGAGKFTLASGYATNINGSLGANDFATKGYVDSTRSLESTYTPSLTNTTNISASTAYTTHYQRIDDVVHVWGEVDIDATTAATISELGLSLPTTTGMAQTYDVAGTAAFEDGTIVQIKGDVTNNRAMFRFTPVTNTNNKYSFHFTYKHYAP